MGSKPSSPLKKSVAGWRCTVKIQTGGNGDAKTCILMQYVVGDWLWNVLGVLLAPAATPGSVSRYVVVGWSAGERGCSGLKLNKSLWMHDVCM